MLAKKQPGVKECSETVADIKNWLCSFATTHIISLKLITFAYT